MVERQRPGAAWCACFEYMQDVTDFHVKIKGKRICKKMTTMRSAKVHVSTQQVLPWFCDAQAQA
jgi:hypothetical protein